LFAETIRTTFGGTMYLPFRWRSSSCSTLASATHAYRSSKTVIINIIMHSLSSRLEKSQCLSFNLKVVPVDRLVALWRAKAGRRLLENPVDCSRCPPGETWHLFLSLMQSNWDIPGKNDLSWWATIFMPWLEWSVCGFCQFKPDFFSGIEYDRENSENGRR
jgi:hypothetical protein